jgi:hypothetical protein
MSRTLTPVIAMFLAASVAAAVQPPPPDLAVLVARANVGGAVAAWCRGEFRSGHPRAYATALTGSAGGRYVILQKDGTVDELGAYTGGADLWCYTRDDAKKLNASIRRSDTIQGQVTPRWNTTVVCGFTEDTTAVCWQYSPADRAYVKVGGWVT